jgi:MerR family transcriptional regulator, copper efflux regulator
MFRVTAGTLRIGQIAAQAGISRDTLRHYERLGVLPRAGRTAGGYREYSASILQRIRFVRNALRFGFSLKQIGLFLRARDAGRAPCREVRQQASLMASEMDRQIDEMVAARVAIRQMLADWDERLAMTPSGSPARLLDTLTARSPSAVSVNRPRLNRRQK